MIVLKDSTFARFQFNRNSLSRYDYASFEPHHGKNCLAVLAYGRLIYSNIRAEKSCTSFGIGESMATSDKANNLHYNISIPIEVGGEFKQTFHALYHRKSIAFPALKGNIDRNNCEIRFRRGCGCKEGKSD